METATPKKTTERKSAISDPLLFAGRLKEARKDMLLEQYQLLDILSKRGISVSPASYSRWEKGDRIPKVDKMEALAKALNVSTDWLIGKSDIKERPLDLMGTKVRQPGYEEYGLTVNKEDLYRFRGEPLWIQGNTGGCWGLIAEAEDVVYLSNGTSKPFYQIEGIIRRFPAPLCYGVESMLEPIPLSKLKTFKRIWVEGIGQSPGSRYKGWFTLDESRNCYVGNNDAVLRTSDYAVTWIAFEDICK